MPPLAPYTIEQDSHSMSSNGSLSNDSWITQPPSTTDELNLSSSSQHQNQSNLQGGGDSNSSTPVPRRNMGGRRPTKPNNLSPEEEEKRKVRRERNKLAAARCRKRRVDHTNELVDEVDGLEKKKQNLQTEIQTLQREKEDLELLLDGHRSVCRLHGNSNGVRSRSPIDVKPNPNILPLLNKVKVEPLEFDGPPSPKR